MTGTLEQRTRSARQLAGLLVLQAAFAGVIIALILRMGTIDPLSPLGVATFYGALIALSLVAAAFEARRHALGEILAVFAGAVGFFLSLSAIMNGYWYVAPFFAVTNLAIFIAIAYRYAVRGESRHEGSPRAPGPGA